VLLGNCSTGSTYSAAARVINTIVVELASLVLAVTTDVASNGDVKVKDSVRVGWLVLEHGNVGGACWAFSNTDIYGCPVTDVLASDTNSSSSPLASISLRNATWVDVVLGGSESASPSVVVVGIWAGQVVCVSTEGVQWNGLGLRSWVIGTADSNVLAEFVLDLDAASSSHAQGLVSGV
jgi:hypothetical protein